MYICLCSYVVMVVRNKLLTSNLTPPKNHCFTCALGSTTSASGLPVKSDIRCMYVLDINKGEL